jgi:hypothetical protein
MRIKFIAPIILACAAMTAAQEPRSPERQEQREKAVLNEDGGQAFLVQPADVPSVGLLKPDQAAESDVAQYSVFLGPGWAGAQLRAREERLSKVLSTIRDHAQMDEVAQAGIANLFGPTFSLEKLDIDGDRNISDLQIQEVLAGLFNDGQLGDPQSDAVYFVYLDPGLHSTLRSLTAAKHYLAYHSFFSVSGARIHYAVVPYQADAQVGYQNALRTLMVAAQHTDDTSH